VRVTVWLRVTGANPSAQFAGSDFRGQVLTLRHPVERVSWLDAYEWTRRLGLRLPTEAQWEYAARAGSHTPWWTGVDARSLEGAGNIADRYAAERETGWRCETWLDDGHHVHAPVGSFEANGFGLHDVVGNVMEWCHDWYRDPGVAPRPGDGLRLGFQAPFRMARSGSYAEAAVGQRSSRRARFLPDFTYNGLGLRPARILE